MSKALSVDLRIRVLSAAASFAPNRKRSQNASQPLDESAPWREARVHEDR